MINSGWNDLLHDHSLPAAIIDLDALDANIERIRTQAERSGKTIRIASKSIRVPFLLKRILERGKGTFQGLLTYSLTESVFLYQEGFRDLLLAYPTLQKKDFVQVIPLLKNDPNAITFMIDSPEHLEFLSACAQENSLPNPIPVCIDLDMSYRPFGIHLGVQRSPIRSEQDLLEFIGEFKKYSSIRLKGLMGYEAQIAGLADQNPFQPILNPIKKFLKRRSVPDVARKRASYASLLKERGISIELFNGGGSGSLTSTLQEEVVTEATAGSGFLQSHLFDYYPSNQQEPAIYIALRSSRRPQSDIITCQGGGIIGSGEAGVEKAMIPVFPEGLSLMNSEGCGEVQTPLRLKHQGVTIHLGDAIFFRPAKAGEPLERFKSVLLISGGKIQGEVPTYRGLNQEFQ